MAKKSKNNSASKQKPNRKEPFGRPTLYKPEYVNEVYLLCRKGFKDKELAEFFGVSEQTLNTWKHEHPDFLESLTRGKDEFDTNEVEDAFLKRAKGFEYTEDLVSRKSNGDVVVRKIKKYLPPDVTAGFIWLRNRNAKRWKDKQEIEHSGKIENPAGVLLIPKGVDKNQWLQLAQVKTESNPENSL